MSKDERKVLIYKFLEECANEGLTINDMDWLLPELRSAYSKMRNQKVGKSKFQVSQEDQ